MSRYFGMVKCIDDNVGRIVERLEAEGKLDSTVIVFTSDHGDLCYEHDRLNKGNPYEGSARVPMILRFPGRIAGQTVYEDPVGTVDVTPTVLELMGIQTDAMFEGRALLKRLAGAQPTDGELAMTFLRNAGTTAQWVAVVDDRYKLVVSVRDRPWLFDREQDPDEVLNFYGRPGTAGATRRLAAALRDYGVATSDPHIVEDRIARSLDACLAIPRD